MQTNEEAILNGKKYISSKRAGEITGYTNDYIGQLCRAGKIDSKMIGKVRFVDKEFILNFKNSTSNAEVSRKDDSISLKYFCENGIDKKEAPLPNIFDFKKFAFAGASLVFLVSGYFGYDYVSVNGLVGFSNLASKSVEVVATVPNKIHSQIEKVVGVVSEIATSTGSTVAIALNETTEKVALPDLDLSDEFVVVKKNIDEVSNSTTDLVSGSTKNISQVVLSSFNNLGKVVFEKTNLVLNFPKKIANNSVVVVEKTFEGISNSTKNISQSVSRKVGGAGFVVYEKTNFVLSLPKTFVEGGVFVLRKTSDSISSSAKNISKTFTASVNSFGSAVSEETKIFADLPKTFASNYVVVVENSTDNVFGSLGVFYQKTENGISNVGLSTASIVSSGIDTTKNSFGSVLNFANNFSQFVARGVDVVENIAIITGTNIAIAGENSSNSISEFSKNTLALLGDIPHFIGLGANGVASTFSESTSFISKTNQHLIQGGIAYFNNVVETSGRVNVYFNNGVDYLVFNIQNKSADIVALGKEVNNQDLPNIFDLVFEETNLVLSFPKTFVNNSVIAVGETFDNISNSVKNISQSISHKIGGVGFVVFEKTNSIANISETELAQLSFRENAEDFAIYTYRTISSWFERKETVIVEAPAETQPVIETVVSTTSQPVAQTTPQVITRTVQNIVNPIKEVVKEVVVETVVSGVSLADLQALENKLKAEIYRVAETASTQSNNNYQAIALTNKIDNLSGVTITGATITNSTISGTTGSFSSSISGSSLTLTGGLTATTGSFSGDVAFDTDTLYVDSVNNRVGVGTSSPTDTFSVNGPVYMASVAVPASVSNRIYNNSGNLYWGSTLIGGASVGSWTTNGSDIYYNTGNVGIGSTTPFKKLSVGGDAWFDGDITASTITATTSISAPYFTATNATATSSFAWLSATRSNLGTIIGGVWNGTSISDSFVDDNITASNYLSLSGWFATTTDGLAEGLTNQYWTNSKFDTRLSATTTLPNLTTLSNLATVGTIGVGTWNGSVIGTQYGGTGQNFSSSSGLIYLTAGTASATTSLSSIYIEDKYLRNDGDDTTTGQLTATNFVANSATATSTFAGGLAVETSGLVYDYSTNNVGIGTASPTQKLDIVSGNIKIDNTTFANQNGIIYKDGTRFIHDFNYGNNGTVTTEGYNTFVGLGSGNLTMGSTATQAYHASYNTAVGRGTLSANTTGYYNTADGYTSLYSNTTGYQNSAQGVFAGRYIADGATANATGNNSLFLGYNTRALADGQTNQIVIGASAIGLGSNTVVLGNDSITTTALRGNVGIGTTSPFKKLSVNGDGWFDGNVTASSFTATSTTATSTFAGGLTVGSSTPRLVVNNFNGAVTVGANNPSSGTATFSVFVGGSEKFYVDANSVYSNSGFTAYTFRAATNGTMTFGNQAITTANNYVNLGTGLQTQSSGSNSTLKISPSLNQSGTAGATDLLISRTETSLGSGAQYLIDAQVGDISRFNVTNLGNVGVGTTSPWRTLSVNGSAAFTNLTNNGTGYYACVNAGTGELATSTTACGASSIRYKENINDLGYGLDTVMQLRPVSFDWKKDFIANGTKQIGFIAEEVSALIPEVIGHDNDGQIMNLDYPKLTSVLVNAVKELNQKVSDISLASEEMVNAVLSRFEELGVRITAGVAYFKAVVVENLTIGSSEKPAGITIYDKATGEPYCLEVINGVMTNTKGVCGGAIEETNSGSVDTEAPVIIINGNNPAMIELSASYVDLGALITDNVDQNLGITTEGVENVNTEVEGVYIITYSATDQAGNTVSVQRTVIVGNPEVEEVVEEIVEEVVVEEEAVIEEGAVEETESIDTESSTINSETTTETDDGGI